MRLRPGLGTVDDLDHDRDQDLDDLVSLDGVCWACWRAGHESVLVQKSKSDTEPEPQPVVSGLRTAGSCCWRFGGLKKRVHIGMPQ
jgi:hypothetical protein